MFVIAQGVKTDLTCTILKNERTIKIIPITRSSVYFTLIIILKLDISLLFKNFCWQILYSEVEGRVKKTHAIYKLIVDR